jgi:Fe-S-cluster containining protein
VALPKDQHDYEKPEAAPESAAIPVLAPKSPYDGPAFDFAHPSIAAPEMALREAAAGLKSALQRLASRADTREGYDALMSALEARMPGLYRCYDGYVSAVLATGESKVACSKGCSHCCSHYVTSVEPYELLFLHGRVRYHESYPSRVVAMHRRTALFKSLLNAKDGDDAEDRALYRYYLRGSACPFLGEGGQCGVYESRPMSCRMFYSMSHPSLCKGKGVIDPGNRNFLIELPEDIEADLARAGSAFARFSLPESLFEGLLKANEAFGRFDAPKAEAGTKGGVPE